MTGIGPTVTTPSDAEALPTSIIVWGWNDIDIIGWKDIDIIGSSFSPGTGAIAPTVDAGAGSINPT